MPMLNTMINLIVHVSFLLCIGMIVVVASKCQRSQIRFAFLILLVIIGFWNLSTILEMDFRLITGVTYMPFVYVCYIGICLVPIAVLHLGVVILLPDWPFRPWHALFLVIPCISIIFIFTDPLHHRFFVNFSLYSSEAVYGAYYYFHSIYSYGCIAAGIVLMLIASTRNSGFFSKQSLLVVAGIIIAVVPNMLYSFGVGHLPFNITVASFTISLLCFTLAFLKYRFITALPIPLRQVVNLISDGYLVLDKQLCILSHNQALLRMFPEASGITLGEGIRTFISEYFLDISYDRFCELQAQAAEQRKTVSAEAHILGDSYVSVEITPVIQGRVQIGSIILLKDITQSRLLIDATQAASRAKSDFLSHMSHEIRTPLNAIIGMINIGMNTDDVDKKNYCFDRADSASKHLLSLISDVLDMSKIEADRLELSYSEFDFEKMLINITNVANVRAEEKKQVFVVNFYGSVPEYIECDELRLSQVITNLLTNAIKFTPEKGSVVLSIETAECGNGEVDLKFTVADNGIGISKEQQERLFTSFSQADAGITKKFGGTGLGLAISKRIVELLGGSIWVESELNCGSKFIFTIKAKKAAGRPLAKLSANIMAEDIRIIAVDSSLEVREYFTDIMKALKLSCHVAENGAEVLELMESTEDKPYNIFFVDWLMPEMDGIELTKRIKKADCENSIILMISAADWSLIEEEAVAAGVSCFISKPLFPSELINAINTCFGAESKLIAFDTPEKAVLRRYDFYRHTLLIAEDIEINREIMSAVLEETNISIDYAENGNIAVAMFSENPDKYSLILMDVNMPEMDGYEATRIIRALDIAKAKTIPIIAMTANVFKEDIDKCIECGMNDHTGKPIDTDALLGALNKYLNYPDQAGRMQNVYELVGGIAWDDSLLTGNALVDMQHQRLFERVSDLVRSCENGSSTEQLQDMLEFLSNYVIRYFTDEEALQLEYGYPDYERHRQQHEDFKLKVRELVNRFSDGGSSEELSRDVNRTLVRWLVQHIQSQDKKIVEHIRSVTASDSVTD